MPMQGRLPWWWFLVLALLLLAPGPASRVLLDIVGGFTLVALLVPLLLGGAGWLGWVLLQRRLRTCPACGFRSFGSEVCPACGTLFASEGTGSATAQTAFDASDVTIDVTATDVDQER
jgi:hypothetical protein